MRRLRVLLLCQAVLPYTICAWQRTTDRASAVGEATQLQDSGKFTEASSVWTRLLKQDPKDVQAMVMLGVLSAQMKRYSEAESYYSKALRLDPDDPAILLNLALAHFKDTDLNGAVPVL